MTISMGLIKELRELTSCGVNDCKKALEESQGDMEKAKMILQQRGLEIASKKSSRVAAEGRIETYVHPGNKIGVIVEVNCETDFVAKSEKFCQFTRDLTLHIVACHPKYIRKEDIPENVLVQQSDPSAFVKEQCLLEQPFVKDPSHTIQDILNALIGSIGENIQIRRFTRFKVSEGD